LRNTAFFLNGGKIIWGSMGPEVHWLVQGCALAGMETRGGWERGISYPSKEKLPENIYIYDCNNVTSQ